eukprot:TRINITY_DN4228_c0_g1_i1.p1 TRINITY_DN4228_c0_g1~~TRINITY_DN4228_c0_g1_i1.p1  ORF type:complete len:183 (+),score=30.66 TRINITY_DN4228_c0_g1_i1:78-626(+)
MGSCSGREVATTSAGPDQPPCERAEAPAPQPKPEGDSVTPARSKQLSSPLCVSPRAHWLHQEKGRRPTEQMSVTLLRDKPWSERGATNPEFPQFQSGCSHVSSVQTSHGLDASGATHQPSQTERQRTELQRDASRLLKHSYVSAGTVDVESPVSPAPAGRAAKQWTPEDAALLTRGDPPAPA